MSACSYITQEQLQRIRDQALRARKERALKQRLAAEEAERAELDRAEEEVQATQRRVAIERANKMLFDDTDRVRMLHSKLLLSEVLAENRALVEHKARVAALRTEREAAFVERQRAALKAAEAVEAEKQEAARRKALAQRDVQLQQLEALKGRILCDRAADRREGELIRAKAAAEAAELAAKEAAYRAEKLQMNEDTTAANTALHEFREQEREREAEAEAAIEAYCTRKAELEDERQRAADRRAADKEARRKAQVEAIEENYKTWHHTEEQRVEADVRAADAKAHAEAAHRSAKRAAQRESDNAMNQQQLRRKADAAAAQRAEAERFRTAWDERLQELRADERREARTAREKAQQVVEFQRWQARRKVAQRSAADVDKLRAALMAQVAVEETESTFQAYANELLGEAAARGLATQPLQLTVNARSRDIQPSM